MIVKYDLMECDHVKGVTWNSNIKICKIKLLVFPKILIITSKKNNTKILFSTGFYYERKYIRHYYLHDISNIVLYL